MAGPQRRRPGRGGEGRAAAEKAGPRRRSPGRGAKGRAAAQRQRRRRRRRKHLFGRDHNCSET
eukprot:1349492-Pleurochrysis_carterae.AAC.1